MKKAPGNKGKEAKSANRDLNAEYDFDYTKAKPNRFASRVDKTQIVVALDPDVSQIFTTAKDVNNALRALIVAMPAAKRR